MQNYIFANEVENFHARTSLLKVIKPLQFFICRTNYKTGCKLCSTEDRIDNELIYIRSGKVYI